MLCRYKFVNTKSSLACLLHPMDISYYAWRYLLKNSPVNGLAFVVCAKRGGGGDEGEERVRKKGRYLLLSPSLFPSSQSSTTFDACYAGYKQAFFLARAYAGTRWGKLIKKRVDISWADLMGRLADGALDSPLHSYPKMRFPYLRDELCIWDIFWSRQK